MNNTELLVWCPAKSTANMLKINGCSWVLQACRDDLQYTPVRWHAGHHGGNPLSAAGVAQPQSCKLCACACSSWTTSADGSSLSRKRTATMVQALHMQLHPLCAAKPCALLYTSTSSSTVALLCLQEPRGHCGAGDAHATAPQWYAGAGDWPGGWPHAGLLRCSRHARF